MTRFHKIIDILLWFNILSTNYYIRIWKRNCGESYKVDSDLITLFLCLRVVFVEALPCSKRMEELEQDKDDGVNTV